MEHRLDFEDSKHAPIPGHELLWCIRVWVIGTCIDRPVEGRIRKMLANIAAPPAIDCFMRFMWVVVLGAQRKLTITCPCNRDAVPDERLLLDVIALYQAARTLEAMILLRSILPAQAALDARDSAEELARILAASGHVLAAPEAADRRHAAFVAADAPMLAAVPTTMH